MHHEIGDIMIINLIKIRINGENDTNYMYIFSIIHNKAYIPNTLWYPFTGLKSYHETLLLKHISSGESKGIYILA